MLSSAAYAVAPSDVYKFDELRPNAANRRTTERYTTLKLANLRYARALAGREKKVKIVPVLPGMMATNFIIRNILITANDTPLWLVFPYPARLVT